MAFNPEQPRDERGRWSSAGGGVALALRREGVRLRSVGFGSTQYGAAIKSFGKPVIYLPQGKVRRADPGAVMKIAHELGHIKNVAMSAGTRKGKIQVERRAWATGVRWLRSQGHRPDLALLKKTLHQTLGTYATGTISGHGGVDIRAAIGTPRERAKFIRGG